MMNFMMKSKYKILLVVLLLVALTAGFAGYFMWNKPKRDVENEKGVAVSAAQLVKEFQENENEANAKYLDKAIEVTGLVAEVSKNQDGKQTILLSSDDAFTGVFCTLKDTENTSLATGANVTIKGICSGMLSDVRLREAVVVINK